MLTWCRHRVTVLLSELWRVPTLPPLPGTGRSPWPPLPNSHPSLHTAAQLLNLASDLCLTGSAFFDRSRYPKCDHDLGSQTALC